MDTRRERLMLANELVTDGDWIEIMAKAVEQAKSGSHGARQWVSDILLSDPDLKPSWLDTVDDVLNGRMLCQVEHKKGVRLRSKVFHFETPLGAGILWDGASLHRTGKGNRYLQSHFEIVY